MFLLIKELVGKWQQFVNNHLEFESNLSEAIIWLDNIDDKLTSCTDFKSNSKDHLEEKLIVIQVKLLTEYIIFICFNVTIINSII